MPVCLVGGHHLLFRPCFVQPINPYKVIQKTVLAVTRNADINTDENNMADEDIDYRQLLQKLLKKRLRLAPVRLEMQYDMNRSFKAFLCEKLNLKEKQDSWPHDLKLSIFAIIEV